MHFLLDALMNKMKNSSKKASPVSHGNLRLLPVNGSAPARSGRDSAYDGELCISVSRKTRGRVVGKRSALQGFTCS